MKIIKKNGLEENFDAEKIKKAIAYAKDLKDRYTVLWLNYDMNDLL